MATEFITEEMVRLAKALVVGGLLAVYVRWLYVRCSSTVSNADAFSRIFPLLTLVTICVIGVVKTSLALSLGLVGALSIVRFRAAIKDPEDLVYLFLCIAIGLALGAEKVVAAVVLVFVVSVFVLGARFLRGGPRHRNLLLTLRGDAARHFDGPESAAFQAVRDLAGEATIQRFDVDEGQAVLRVVVRRKGLDESAALIADLRRRLDGCQLSYVDMDTIL